MWLFFFLRLRSVGFDCLWGCSIEPQIVLNVFDSFRSRLMALFAFDVYFFGWLFDCVWLRWIASYLRLVVFDWFDCVWLRLICLIALIACYCVRFVWLLSSLLLIGVDWFGLCFVCLRFYIGCFGLCLIDFDCFGVVFHCLRLLLGSFPLLWRHWSLRIALNMFSLDCFGTFRLVLIAFCLHVIASARFILMLIALDCVSLRWLPSGCFDNVVPFLIACDWCWVYFIAFDCVRLFRIVFSFELFVLSLVALD